MNYSDVLANARQCIGKYCKACPVCNGRKRRLEIKAELCKGCGKCKRNCPMEAISGEIRMPHTIDNDKCIHCGACWGACPFGAIDAIEEED